MTTTSESPREFFHGEKAEQNAMWRKPVPGVDYPQKDVHAENACGLWSTTCSRRHSAHEFCSCGNNDQNDWSRE